MTATLTPPGVDVPREVLLEKTEKLEKLVQPSARRDEHPNRELEERRKRRMKWYRKIEDGVLDLANALPVGTEDYEARKLFEFLTELRRALESDPQLTDPKGRTELTCMKMLDVLYRMSRAIEHTRLEEPQTAAEFIFNALSSLPATDLSELLGVSTKTIGVWRGGGAVRTNTNRVKLVAKLCCYLRAATTPLGIMMWFRNQADLLGGRSPLDLIGEGEPDPNVWTKLVNFARGARGQLAS